MKRLLRAARRTRAARGQASVELALVLPVLLMLLLALVQTALVARDDLLVQDAARAAVREASVGAAAILASRAGTAADAAALAGADALALGRSSSAAVAAAQAAASDNGARLVSCTCRDGSAEVVVVIGRAHGRARAIVDAEAATRVPRRAP